MSVVALVGAQYGSEGKGLIAGKLANCFDVHIRTGAPNAGHTYYIDAPVEETPGQPGDGPVQGRRKIVARSVPCGVKNPGALLVIGPGGLIDVDLLVREVKELDALGLHASDRLIVDGRCGVIDPMRHHHFEGGVDGIAHAMIGSTGEGVGPARMARIARGTFNAGGQGPSWSKFYRVQDHAEVVDKLTSAGIRIVADVTVMYEGWLVGGANILLEGTQGSGLSLIHGPWPTVTSSDTNAAQLCVDAGISPLDLEEVILVARSYPIRVAGNSGPLENEISFDDLGVEPERTTVTQKVRRIGEWDHDLFARAVRLNSCTDKRTSVALTFADYIDAAIANRDFYVDVTEPVREFVDKIQIKHGVDVHYIGTGPDSLIVSNYANWWTS